MSQQYELNLVDEAEVLSARKVPPWEAGARRLTVIDVGPKQERSGAPARALKAQPSFLPENSLAADAFRLTLLQCKWHITGNMRAVVEERDVEGMHQLRVALRRLRVALSSFGGDFRSPQLEAIRLRAKTLANRLGPARDLDVFAEELFEPAANANGALDAFEVLRKRAQRARRTVWDDAVLLVTGPGFRVFLSDLDEVIDRRPWSDVIPGHGHATKGILAFETPGMKLADRILAHRLKGARKRARHLNTLSDTERHGLRITLKKLRYTAEFFAPYYEKPKVEKFLGRLTKMQDSLGGLNDVAVARKTLDLLVSADDVPSSVSGSEISFAAGLVYGWHLQRATRMWDDALSRWKKLGRTKPFWNEAS
jgi:CHAD domain-containing protein